MEISINVGELDTLVSILRATQTRGDRGDVRYEYIVDRQVFAKLDQSETENVSNSNLEEGDRIELTCYKVPALDSTWRVQIGTAIYQIIGINPISRVSPLCVLSLEALDK